MSKKWSVEFLKPVSYDCVVVFIELMVNLNFIGLHILAISKGCKK